MPSKKDASREELIKDEREIGKNIPDAMVGLDDGDVRPPADAAKKPAEGEDEDASRH